MGEHDVNQKSDPAELRRFVRAILDDVTALERMLERGMFETGVRRIGAEIEMFLVDAARHPSNKGMEVLERLANPNFTTELARFNLEANCEPRVFGGSCLREMENELLEYVGLARKHAREEDAEVVLCGILPTLRLRDLSLDNMSPIPRYFALNHAMNELRGGHFRVRIKGLDELDVTHDNVMLESCNTSFQIHFQVAPDEFARLYNVAQAVTGPVLAAAVNSPTLLAQRLWMETRVALFQQSIDERSTLHMAREARPRVRFGSGWIRESVLEIFKEDLSRFRAVLAAEHETNALELVNAGKPPPLSALRLYNGTIYRWNRPCYGVHNGQAHLRVENRVLPAGPTVLDQTANAAFFFGLMAALSNEYDDIATKLEFDDAKGNFFAAARHGLQAQFVWTDGATWSASALILDHLLPLARQGLDHQGVPSEDIDRYLGVLEERVKSGRTGSQWMMTSLSAMAGKGTRDARLRALTSAMIARQKTEEPVHTWELAGLDEEEDWRHSYRTVAQIMTRDLLTVRPEDLVDLAAAIMRWEQIRHLPVEDTSGHLLGLLSHEQLLGLVGQGPARTEQGMAVQELMITDVVTCSPDTTTLEAMQLMRDRSVRSLPVVEDGRLVGIVTERDFLDVAASLMEDELRRE